MFVRACRYTPYDNRIPKVNRYEKKEKKTRLQTYNSWVKILFVWLDTAPIFSVLGKNDRFFTIDL
jgi:hypothetical protein